VPRTVRLARLELARRYPELLRRLASAGAETSKTETPPNFIGTWVRTFGEPAHSAEKNHVANRPQAGRPCIYALRLGSQMAVFLEQRPWPVWCRVVDHDDQPAASAFSRAPHLVSSYGLRR